MNFPVFSQLSRELGFRDAGSAASHQHAKQIAAPESETRPHPPRCVEAEAIAGSSAAMRWLRRFGERVGAQDTRSSDSARRLYARILTACGLHLTPFRHSSLLLVSNSQGPRSRKPSSEAGLSFC
jgi:hypothetical protein